MKTNVQGRRQLSRRILLISAVAWMVLLLTGVSGSTHAHHPSTELGSAAALLPTVEGKPAPAMAHAHHSPAASGAAQPSAPLLPSEDPEMNPEMNPEMYSAIRLVASQMAGWAIMLVAMMTPTLIAPISHIIERSFTRRRGRSVALFVLGYGAVWMGAGVILLAMAQLLMGVAAQSTWPALAVGILAFVWQCSPIKQRCLNRSHNHRALAAFGRRADVDVLRFGLSHGVWCAGSCWLLMLLPLLMPSILMASGHLAMMALVTFVMIGERLEEPGPLRWRLRPRGTLLRLLVVQTQLQWQRAQVRRVSQIS